MTTVARAWKISLVSSRPSSQLHLPAEQGTPGHDANGRALPPAIDRFYESYVSWREASAQVWRAYERWVGCPSSERRLAHAAYAASLDREEIAACLHALCSDRLFAGAR
jgi:hypothetical protein